LADLGQGCAFAPRCAKASPDCNTPPPLQQLANGRSALCHHPILWS
jgi:peptide/nickel transport system ATP-binding protein